MMVDTDVLIWYSRGHPSAVDYIHHLDGFFISVVTYMEIVQGVRNKKELFEFKKALGILQAKVLQIDEVISIKAMFYLDQYTLSHHMELGDALIGATSTIKHLKLITANEKHYKHLPGIIIEKFHISS